MANNVLFDHGGRFATFENALKPKGSAMPFQLKNGKSTDFGALKNALARKPGVKNPAALAAKIEKKDTGKWPNQKKK